MTNTHNFPDKGHLQTIRSLDFLWSLWKFFGFYYTEKYNWLQTIHVTFIIGILNIFGIVTFIVQLFFIEDLEELLLNIPTGITATACLVKVLLVWKHRVQFIKLEQYFGQLDRNMRASKYEEKIRETVFFCQRFTKMMSLYYGGAIVFAAVSAALAKELLFNTWIPYNYRDPEWLYWLTFAMQSFLLECESVQNSTVDSCGPAFFIMLNTQLEILLDRMENIGWDGKKSQNENFEELLDCISNHKTIMRILGFLQDSVSYIMLVQFTATALALSLEALLFLEYPQNLMGSVFQCSFFVGVTVEILPCCYYSDNFMALTDRLVTAIYSCNFSDQSATFKKTAIIFMQMTQKERVITTAKLIPVTLQTFASIMRLSYSLLTVVSGLK